MCSVFPLGSEAQDRAGLVTRRQSSGAVLGCGHNNNNITAVGQQHHSSMETRWRLAAVVAVVAGMVGETAAIFKCPDDGHWPDPESCAR